MAFEKYKGAETEPTWTIEFARPGDSQQIADIQKAGWLAAYPDPSVGLTQSDIESIDFATPEKLAMWEDSIEKQSDAKRIWVARENDTILGYAVAEKRDDGHELRAIYVRPECHGRNIGTALMDHALEWLGSKRDVNVWVFTHNKRAINFYRKCGFVESSKTSSLLVNGKEIPDLEMIRKAV